MADPTKYIKKILESCECTFGSKPRKAGPPVEESDCPELDTSELCNDEQIRQYQTLIGQIKWAITLGRLDIAASVMTMSRFRQAPRVGHLQQVKRIFGYLGNLPHGAIRYRTHEPDYSYLPHKKYDWERTVYTSSREELPHDLPKRLGKQVTSTHNVDTNLHHDLVTGSNRHSMYPQCNSSSLALQETIDCGHSNFWFRISSCNDSC